jgi:hypothetical protein
MTEYQHFIAEKVCRRHRKYKRFRDVFRAITHLWKKYKVHSMIFLCPVCQELHVGRVKKGTRFKRRLIMKSETKRMNEGVAITKVSGSKADLLTEEGYRELKETLRKDFKLAKESGGVAIATPVFPPDTPQIVQETVKRAISEIMSEESGDEIVKMDSIKNGEVTGELKTVQIPADTKAELEVVGNYGTIFDSPNYINHEGDRDGIILSEYQTLEEAQKGHQTWLEKLSGDDVPTILHCASTGANNDVRDYAVKRKGTPDWRVYTLTPFTEAEKIAREKLGVLYDLLPNDLRREIEEQAGRMMLTETVRGGTFKTIQHTRESMESLGREKPYSTMIHSLHYTPEDEIVVVEEYDTEAEARAGHEKWKAVFHAQTLPEEIRDVSTSKASKVRDQLHKLTDRADPRVFKYIPNPEVPTGEFNHEMFKSNTVH